MLPGRDAPLPEWLKTPRLEPVLLGMCQLTRTVRATWLRIQADESLERLSGTQNAQLMSHSAKYVSGAGEVAPWLKCLSFKYLDPHKPVQPDRLGSLPLLSTSEGRDRGTSDQAG